MAVDVGEVDQPQSRQMFSKRNVLIGALAIGAIVGLIVLLKRNATGGGGGGTATTGTGDITPIALQNIATQLLQFRGDVSVANADLLDKMAKEATARQESDATTRGMIGNETERASKASDLLLQVFGIQSAAGQYNASSENYGWGMYFKALEGDYAGRAAINEARVPDLERQAAGLGSLTANYNADLTQYRQRWPSQTGVTARVGTGEGIFTGTEPTNPRLPRIGTREGIFTTGVEPINMQVAMGAGGIDLRDVILAAFDAGNGDGSEGYAKMSSGPVRYVA